MKGRLSERSRIVASKEQTSCDFDGETVMLDTRSGKYYGLNEVATMVWDLVQQPRTLKEIREAVEAQFNVTAERCDSDLQAWLQDMVDEGLVEIEGDATEDDPDA